jgi:CO dehydrogenase/acetyl-CoA synthase gamma subunit (corrinoid Fe-S protein)
MGRVHTQAHTVLPLHNCCRCSSASSTDTFIQKTRKLYVDTRTQRNLAKLNDELGEVHSIMTRNIQEVLGQGEKLDSKCLVGYEHVMRYHLFVL